MAKVFIANVDSPIGYSVSLLFSKKFTERPVQQKTEEGQEENAPEMEKVPYTIVGTLSKTPAENVSKPGELHLTGNKEVDALRKERIQKFPVPGAVPSWVSRIVNPSNKEEFNRELNESEIVIYDVFADTEESLKAINELSKSQGEDEKQKVFIGISNILTWTRTVVDPEDPEASILEEEYRRRRAHSGYKPQIAAEREIMKIGKRGNVRSYIINTGLVHHAGDSIFHFMFMDAWLNNSVSCYGEGDNVIPFVHMDDLVQLVFQTATTSPETRYILAIDSQKHTLFEICKAVSDTIGNGVVKKVPFEEALLNKNLNKMEYELLRVNLRLQANAMKELVPDLKYDSGFVENIKTFAQEYKDARGFHPVKILIHGPPGVGKSHMSQALMDYYHIPIITGPKAVQEYVDNLEKKLSELSEDSENDGGKELVEEIQDAKNANAGQFSKEHQIRFVKEKLLSRAVKNQGYILDGLTFNEEDAKNLFAPTEDGDQDQAGEGTTNGLNSETVPEFVISLEASDIFLKKRIMSIPDGKPGSTSEDAFLRKLETYRTANTDDNTVLNFFDEHEIHALSVNAEEPFEVMLGHVITHAGHPRNYGPSKEDLKKKQAELDLQKVFVFGNQKKQEQELLQAKKKKAELEEEEQHRKELANWNLKLDEIRKQEQEVVEAQAVPLRGYLMKYVMPTLTAGLIDVCKVRPEDPVDFLAEYLFKASMAETERDVPAAQ